MLHEGPEPWTRRSASPALISAPHRALASSFFYWVSFASPCHAAPAEIQGLPSVVYDAHQCDTTVASSSSTSSSSTASSSAADASAAGDEGKSSVHSRQLSAAGGPAYAEINELATLLLQPQEVPPLPPPPPLVRAVGTLRESCAWRWRHRR